MKLPKGKNILGVFAHPDDDVFGPGGTIIKLARENNFYEIFVTNGQAGRNQATGKKENNLGRIRKKEAKESAKILGVKKVFFLNFKDGKLSNSLYHKVADLIEKIIRDLKIDFLLAYELKGVSGHIDHVFTSMVVSYLAKKLGISCWYYCLTKKQRQLIDDYFIFFPSGYKRDEVDFLVDIADVVDLKIKAIKCHKTQAKDGAKILKNIKKQFNWQEAFIIE